jgi:CheY-like chemotaxis protein
LQVSSDVGRGTQMKVYLPAIKETQVYSRSIEEQFDGNGELVLMVDDDSAVQFCTQSLLESHLCYRVLSASEGESAIALYRQHHNEIRLVILDIMMPNMDGISLIRELKTINPTVKIIAMSGLPSNRDPALAAGATVFLSKPYTLDTLLEHLHALVTA